MIKITLAALFTLFFSSQSFASFAYGSRVQVKDGVMPIENFSLGADVSVLDSGSTLGAMSLTEERVSFSSGTGPNANMMGMIYLNYGDEGAGLVVTPGQVFLTANQRLVPASKLTIGDQLLSKDGKSVPIRAISVGNYHGGVHHIATESDSTFGNYLIVGGVWVGSYKIEIFYNSGNLKDINIFQDQPLR